MRSPWGRRHPRNRSQGRCGITRERLLITLLVVGLTSAISVSAAIWSHAQPALTMVRFAIVGDILAYSPVFLAQEQRYFRDEGLKVEFIQLSSGSMVPSAVLSGSVDFGLAYLGHTINAASQRQRLKSIAVVSQGNPNVITLSKQRYDQFQLSARSSVEEKARAIRGAKFGVSGFGSGSHEALEIYLEKIGLDSQKDVQVIALTGGPSAGVAAMSAGLVDGVSLGSPIGETLVVQGKGAILANLIKGEDVPELSGMIFMTIEANQDFLDRNLGVAKRFVAAIAKAQAFAHARPTEARDILYRARYAQLPAEVMNLAWNVNLPGIPKTPVITLESAEKTLRVVNRSRVAAGQKPIEIGYDAYVQNVYEQ